VRPRRTCAGSSGWASLLVLLALGLTGCGERPADNGSPTSPAAGPHPLVATFFAACTDGDLERLRQVLTGDSLEMLEGLYATGTEDALARAASALARAPVPACSRGAATAHGYQLECRNLGRDFQLEVVVDGKAERLRLPSAALGGEAIPHVPRR
jgi:hypothetical protein